LERWTTHALFGVTTEQAPAATDIGINKPDILDKLHSFTSDIETMTLDELVFRSRDIMDNFSSLVIGVLMMVDVERDGDAIGIELLKRFATQHGFGGSESPTWTTAAQWDSRIVFGEGEAGVEMAKSRL
jgi:hypothetical protein